MRSGLRAVVILMLASLMFGAYGAQASELSNIIPMQTSFPKSLESDPVQSSVSVFLNCPSTVAFAIPGTPSSCSSGYYSAVYTGIPQTVGSSQSSAFYLAGATGGVKVDYTLTDSNKTIVSGKAYGKIPGGDCTAPTKILGNFTVVVGTSAVIASGDTLKAFLNITFTGTGNPVFCSGGSSATLMSVQTTPVTGTTTPLLTTTLTAGRANQGSLLGYTGVSISYVNTAAVAVNAIVFGVVRNGAGNIVGHVITSISATPGQNVTAFLTLYGFPPGTYDVTAIAASPTNVPLSTPATAVVTV